MTPPISIHKCLGLSQKSDVFQTTRIYYIYKLMDQPMENNSESSPKDVSNFRSTKNKERKVARSKATDEEEYKYRWKENGYMKGKPNYFTLVFWKTYQRGPRAKIFKNYGILGSVSKGFLYLLSIKLFNITLNRMVGSFVEQFSEKRLYRLKHIFYHLLSKTKVERFCFFCVFKC